MNKCEKLAHNGIQKKKKKFIECAAVFVEKTKLFELPYCVVYIWIAFKYLNNEKRVCEFWAKYKALVFNFYWRLAQLLGRKNGFNNNVIIKCKTMSVVDSLFVKNKKQLNTMTDDYLFE